MNRISKEKERQAAERFTDADSIEDLGERIEEKENAFIDFIHAQVEAGELDLNDDSLASREIRLYFGRSNLAKLIISDRDSEGEEWKKVD